MQIISLIFKTILGKGSIEERGYTSDTGENEKKRKQVEKIFIFQNRILREQG